MYVKLHVCVYTHMYGTHCAHMSCMCTHMLPAICMYLYDEHVRFESAVKKEHFGIHHPPEVCTVPGYGIFSS